MTTKTVELTLYYRDDFGVRTGQMQTVPATTEDDGLTIIFGLGFLPGLNVALPEDIIVSVNPPTTVIPVSSASLVVDEEAQTQTLTVTPA